VVHSPGECETAHTTGPIYRSFSDPRADCAGCVIGGDGHNFPGSVSSHDGSFGSGDGVGRLVG